jgi:hypothetical protein
MPKLQHRYRVYKIRSDARLTREQVRAAYELHRAGWSLRAIAGEIWERYGYASKDACASALSYGLRLEGLPVADRIESVREFYRRKAAA